MDVMEGIDKTLTDARATLEAMKCVIEALEKAADILYLKSLDMISQGIPEEQINSFLLKEWGKILSHLKEVDNER